MRKSKFTESQIVATLKQVEGGRQVKDVCRELDVPPILSSTSVWSPIPYPKEIGREEAFFRRTDHRLPARSRSGHSDQGLMPAAWLQ
ncbi:transposase [Xanthomonas euvesicatoria]|uniref:transposase n=1 Tax=Xanthomonas euvesicatoria TaxID=456327 RepID=UPI003A0FF7DA